MNESRRPTHDNRGAARVSDLRRGPDRPEKCECRDGTLVRNVNAEVCASCGEQFYDMDAMRRLEETD